MNTPSTSLQAQFAALTDVGKVRLRNEDAFIAQTIWDDRHILLAVIDGMGGYSGGDIAASIARKTIIQCIEESKGKYDDDTYLIRLAITLANNAIVEARESDHQNQEMGCVATIGLLDLDHEQLIMGHVGDTRLYRLENGNWQKLSHDHSFVGRLEEEGELSETEAMSHPQRNLVDRSLGYTKHEPLDSYFIDIALFDIHENSSLLFCSDGLSDYLNSSTLQRILSSNLSINEKAQTLISHANNAGGKDNITVVLTEIAKKAEDENSQNIEECNQENVCRISNPNQDDENQDNTSQNIVINIDSSQSDSSSDSDHHLKKMASSFLKRFNIRFSDSLSYLLFYLLGIGTGIYLGLMDARHWHICHERSEITSTSPIDSTLILSKPSINSAAQLDSLLSDLSDEDTIKVDTSTLNMVP